MTTNTINFIKFLSFILYLKNQWRFKLALANSYPSVIFIFMGSKPLFIVPSAGS
jgi:hypothetical protein